LLLFLRIYSKKEKVENKIETNFFVSILQHIQFIANAD